MEFKDGLNAIAKMCREQRADKNKDCAVCSLLGEDGDCLLCDCCPEDYDVDKVAEVLGGCAVQNVETECRGGEYEKLPVSRLHAEVKNVLAKIDALFKQKNLQYRDGVDDFANFTKGAALRYGRVNMLTRFEALKDMCEKHIAHVYNHPLAGVKVDESLMDIAVYMILALVMHKRMTDGERVVPIESVEKYVREEYF